MAVIHQDSQGHLRSSTFPHIFSAISTCNQLEWVRDCYTHSGVMFRLNREHLSTVASKEEPPVAFGNGSFPKAVGTLPFSSLTADTEFNKCFKKC